MINLRLSFMNLYTIKANNKNMDLYNGSIFYLFTKEKKQKPISKQVAGLIPTSTNILLPAQRRCLSFKRFS
jgi:hypothetical protein